MEIVSPAIQTAKLAWEPILLPTAPAVGTDSIYKPSSASKAAPKTVSPAPILPLAPNAFLDTLLSQEMVKLFALLA